MALGSRLCHNLYQNPLATDSVDNKLANHPLDASTENSDSLTPIFQVSSCVPTLAADFASALALTFALTPNSNTEIFKQFMKAYPEA